MKNTLSLIIATLISASAFAKTEEGCRNEMEKNRSILSLPVRSEIHLIVDSNLSPQQMIVQATAALKKEDCVVLLTAANDSQVEGVASSLIANLLAIPKSEVTDEVIDGMVGFMLSEK